MSEVIYVVDIPFTRYIYLYVFAQYSDVTQLN